MNFFIFQRLSKNLQTFPGKFRHFIQKKYAPVCQSNFPRAWNPASSCQCLWRTGMMGTAKWPFPDQWIFFCEKSCHTVYFCYLQTLLKSKFRHNCRQTPCKHGFPGTRWANKKDIVKPADCDFRCSSCRFLTTDIRKIDTFFFLAFSFFYFRFRICIHLWFLQAANHICQCLHTNHLHIPYQPSLSQVFLRNNTKSKSKFSCPDHPRQNPGNSMNFSIQTDFAYNQNLF